MESVEALAAEVDEGGRGGGLLRHWIGGGVFVRAELVRVDLHLWGFHEA